MGKTYRWIKLLNKKNATKFLNQRNSAIVFYVSIFELKFDVWRNLIQPGSFLYANINNVEKQNVFYFCWLYNPNQYYIHKWIIWLLKREKTTIEPIIYLAVGFCSQWSMSWEKWVNRQDLRLSEETKNQYN